MKLLKQRIIKDGKVLEGDVLKVDSFLNHNIDTALLSKIGDAFSQTFVGCGITKILTIEASGIAVACLTAERMNVPLLFAKKSSTSNMDKTTYSAAVQSYTHGKVYNVMVATEYLCATDKVLIIDDFLAHGEAVRGLFQLIKQAGATLVGVGIVIEKGYQGGGDALREAGIRVESLAIIDSMSVEKGIVFRD